MLILEPVLPYRRSRLYHGGALRAHTALAAASTRVRGMEAILGTSLLERNDWAQRDLRVCLRRREANNAVLGRLVEYVCPNAGLPAP